MRAVPGAHFLPTYSIFSSRNFPLSIVGTFAVFFKNISSNANFFLFLLHRFVALIRLILKAFLLSLNITLYFVVTNKDRNEQTTSLYTATLAGVLNCFGRCFVRNWFFEEKAFWNKTGTFLSTWHFLQRTNHSICSVDNQNFGNGSLLCGSLTSRIGRPSNLCTYEFSH